MRIRSIAEHAMIPDPADEMNNTRTTVARWWERVLIAPNRVNFHLEHHLLPTVPHYNLPRMHRMLRERGILADACVATSYADVLRLAASRT
jgi:fatty acid desaturase